MTTAEVEKLCGKPNYQFITQCGNKTDEPWRGLVYYYYTTAPDSMYYEIPALKYCTVVFSLQSGTALLHHWKK